MSRARGLLQTGALPQCLWGHQSLGVAPTTLKRIRATAAAATAIGGHGRCASTALALTLTHLKDPAITIALDQITTFLDLFKSMDPYMRGLTVRHWSDIYRSVVSNGRSGLE